MFLTLTLIKVLNLVNMNDVEWKNASVKAFITLLEDSHEPALLLLGLSGR